jgi:hypothetical protein
MALNEQQPQTPNVDRLPENVKAQAIDAARPSVRLMQNVSETVQQAQQSAPTGRGDSPEALFRNQGDQGKEQFAMSPTDHSSSRTATQQRAMGRSRGMER